MIAINGVNGQSGANARRIIIVEKDLEAESVFVTDQLGYLLRLAMNLAQLNLKNVLALMEIVPRMLMCQITPLGYKFEKTGLDPH